MNNRLSPFTQDILSETMNIGGAHAVTALGKIIGKRINISTPRVGLQSIEDVPGFMGKAEDIVSVILHHVVGDVAGYILLAFSEADARKLALQLSKGADEEAQMAALREVGNVISGSCFTALNKFLDLKFERSVPDAATDMTGALLNSIVAELGQRADDALVTHLHFSVQNPGISGGVYLILDPDSTQRILLAAQKKWSAD